MGQCTIEAMQKAYGTRPEDVIAAIGPSICQDCYEVSEDVADAFYREFRGAGDGEGILISKGNGKYLIHLRRAYRSVLAASGVFR